MSIYKRGNVYWYKFMWNGQFVRESTKQGNARKARDEESKHRARLAEEMKERRAACERLGCSVVSRCHQCERLFNAEEAVTESGRAFCSDACSSSWTKRHTRVAKLAEFLERDFLPFIESQFRASEPKTADYYSYGTKLILGADLGDLRLDEITSQYGGGLIARYSNLSPSTQNCGLRTLRRALNLAYEWGKLERPVDIKLAKGERQRERVLSDAEFYAYRELCRQPWRDVAVLVWGAGLRPGEAYVLRWENVLLAGDEGLIRIVEGKSKAARRQLPTGDFPVVQRMLLDRWELQNFPVEGWVFPADSKSGHLEQTAAKIQHADALKKLTAAKLAFDEWVENGSNGSWEDAIEARTKLTWDYISPHALVLQAGLKPFEPYCLRHTALTRLAEFGCDTYTLARIAGHSSIMITQRYCHPQAEAIELAFKRRARGHNFGHNDDSRRLPAKGAEVVKGSIKKG